MFMQRNYAAALIEEIRSNYSLIRTKFSSSKNALVKKEAMFRCVFLIILIIFRFLNMKSIIDIRLPIEVELAEVKV